ncbi:DUF4367 domain-containing protein [Halopiger goleimassiliensis]|uniref:DUF4367 domain-containing protein n=1 Tax=Halopiger goleimassiliensis TaxID=1293048 RepID=UPI001E29BFBE|nr:DUF4367 domain-containing protein [Halopiger goleimassiliensis]
MVPIDGQQGAGRGVVQGFRYLFKSCCRIDSCRQMTARKLIPALTVALLVVTAGCLGGFGPTEEDPGDTEDLPDGDELLEQSMEAESNVDTLQGVQTTTITTDGETVETKMEVWQSGDQYRAELLETENPEEFDVMVVDGSETWMYDEDENRAVLADLGLDAEALEAFGEELSDAIFANMSATVDGTDTVADRDVYVLELEGDGDALYESATLWVDQETHYPLKQEATTSFLQEMTTTVTFETVTFDEPIDDERFTFDVPDDAEVVEMSELGPEQYDSIEAAEEAVPFDPPRPEVPDEYSLETVTANEALPGWTASMQYQADDGSLLSVSVSEAGNEPVFDADGETIEIDGVDAVVQELPGSDMTSIEWEQDGLTYTVSGDLETDDLVSVAESIIE